MIQEKERAANASAAANWDFLHWGVGIVAVLGAILAQHSGDVKRIPVLVLSATIVAISGAAIAFPRMSWRAGQLTPVPVKSRLVFLAAVLFLVPATVSFAVWQTEPFHLTHAFVHAGSSWAAVLWISGMFGGLAILWAIRPECESPHGVPAFDGQNSMSRLGWIALIAILALATILRTWHLSTLPEGIWSDEADSAADAVRLLHLPFQPFPPGNFGHNPGLYFYAMAALIRMGGNTIEIARGTSATFGVLSVVVVFVLGYRVRNAYLGLCAATLMAVSKWAITFSRVAMPNIPIPAVTGLGYAAFIIAMQKPRPFWLALSGVLLGLSFDTYPGAYLPAIVPIGILFMRCKADREFQRACWPGRLFLPLCLVVGAAPMLTTLGLDGNFVLLRVHVTSLYNEYHDMPHRLAGLLDNLRAYAFMFTVQGDQNGRHNLSGAPMLDPVTGSLFLLGLGICLRQPRHWLSQTLLLWLGTNLLSGALSVDYEAPHGARTLGALAPITVIAAAPLLYLETSVRAAHCRVSRIFQARADIGMAEARRSSVRLQLGFPTRVVAFAIAGALLSLALDLNANQYFRNQANDLRSWQAMDGQITIIGRSVDRLNRNGFTVFVDRSIEDDIVLHYVAPTWKSRGYDPANPLRGLVGLRHVALVIPYNQRGTLNNILAREPGAKIASLAPAFEPTTIEAYVITLDRVR